MKENITIFYNENEYSIAVVRSKRKTVQLSINLEGKIEIKVPFPLKKREIIEILEKKVLWIERTMKSMEEREVIKKEITFTEGSLHLYEGEKYYLHLIEEKNCFQPFVEIEGNLIIMTAFHHNELMDKNILLNWYYQQVLEKIQMIIKKYWKHFEDSGKIIKSIKIKEQKTRWGSCSLDGNLNFNWKLILLEPELLEYVVIHELCHLKQMNHSPEFWKEVRAILPDYKERKLQLKEVILE